MPELKMKMRHIRSVNEDGMIRNRGGATVSALVDTSTNLVHKYAIAYCNPRENFKRKAGRIKSTNRMLNGHTLVLPMSWDELVSNASHEVDMQLLTERQRIIDKYEEKLSAQLAKLK